MPLFRKKPVEIEARQLQPENTLDLDQWITDNGGVAARHRDGLLIKTMEGDMVASYGDWIIKGIAGEFYPCKPDIFDATYERVA